MGSWGSQRRHPHGKAAGEVTKSQARVEPGQPGSVDEGVC